MLKATDKDIGALSKKTSKLKKTLRNLEVFIRRKSGVTEKDNYSDWYGGIVDVDHISPLETVEAFLDQIHVHH